jgi:rubredoxin
VRESPLQIYNTDFIASRTVAYNVSAWQNMRFPDTTIDVKLIGYPEYPNSLAIRNILIMSPEITNFDDAKPDEPVTVWRCKECGLIHYGPNPPDFCPVCGQPGTQFEPLPTRKKRFS